MHLHDAPVWDSGAFFISKYCSPTAKDPAELTGRRRRCPWLSTNSSGPVRSPDILTPAVWGHPHRLHDQQVRGIWWCRCHVL